MLGQFWAGSAFGWVGFGWVGFLLNWLFVFIKLMVLAWVGFACWVSFSTGLALVLVGFGPGLSLGQIGYGLVWLCAKLDFCQVGYMGWVGFGLD